MNYIRHYTELCRSRKVSNVKEDTILYYERHHIIPKCMGGDDTGDNIVLLTPREHYIAHLLLYRHHKSVQSEYVRPLAFALVSMSNNNTNPNLKRHLTTSNDYGIIREAAMLSRIGHKVADTTRYKQPKSDKHRDAIKRARIGTKLSDETKRKISKSRIGIPLLHNSIMVECPICERVGQMVAMKRWHFNNCKYGRLNA